MSSVVYGYGFDDTVYLITVCHCLAQRFQQHCSCSFSSHISVRFFVKGFASPIRTEYTCLAECDVIPGIQNQIDRAGNGGITFPVFYGHDCAVDRKHAA